MSVTEEGTWGQKRILGGGVNSRLSQLRTGSHEEDFRGTKGNKLERCNGVNPSFLLKGQSLDRHSQRWDLQIWERRQCRRVGG